MTWLDNQIKKIESTKSDFKNEIQIIKNVDPNISNEFEERTPLKLIFLNYALDMYTIIIKKYFTNLFYIDLFAGSGINRMRSCKDDLIGSPFIALLNHKDDYNKFIFCENDPMFFSTLSKRVSTLSINNVELIPRDCNNELNKILGEINKYDNKHAFFFIDPHCMEFKWQSMEKMLSIRSDIIFTFMTHHILRACTGAFANPHYSTNTLNKFFGNDSWKSLCYREDLLKIYSKNILKVRPNALIKYVNIGNYYDLMFITNKTKGNNPWIKCIITAKKEIERNPDSCVKIALDKLNRGQKDLFGY